MLQRIRAENDAIRRSASAERERGRLRRTDPDVAMADLRNSLQERTKAASGLEQIGLSVYKWPDQKLGANSQLALWSAAAAYDKRDEEVAEAAAALAAAKAAEGARPMEFAQLPSAKELWESGSASSTALPSTS